MYNGLVNGAKSFTPGCLVTVVILCHITSEKFCFARRNGLYYTLYRLYYIHSWLIRVGKVSVWMENRGNKIATCRATLRYKLKSECGEYHHAPETILLHEFSVVGSFYFCNELTRWLKGNTVFLDC